MTFQIDNEVLVYIKGSVQSELFDPIELGLASEGIQITHTFRKKDIHVDDFGPDVPVETLHMLAWANVRIPLIHYDRDVLNACMAESQGGTQRAIGDFGNILQAAPGTMAPAGTPLGGGLPMFASGNHLISLNLFSALSGGSYHFLATHLAEQPVSFQMGTQARVAVTNWRAIPYVPWLFYGPTGKLAPSIQQNMSSSGVQLWDTNLDQPPPPSPWTPTP